VDEGSPRYCTHPLIVVKSELEEPVQKASLTIVSYDIDPDDFLFQPGPEYGCIHGVDCIGVIRRWEVKSILGTINQYSERGRVESEPTQEELEDWDEWMGLMLYPELYHLGRW
jgi:hypothetical protein